MEQIENDQIVTMTEVDSSSSSLSTTTNEKTLVFIIPHFLKKKIINTIKKIFNNPFFPFLKDKTRR
jgi:hypothetical protein